jgi:DNA-binding transcriptional ArsR family regulator
VEAALRAIAQPRRRAILRLIASGELPAAEIASHFDVTRPAISQHLAVLREAGLVSERRAGTRRYYRARPEALGELRAFLEEMWDTSLARLKRAAEAEHKAKEQHRDRKRHHRRN